jgi:hypothetical protein
MRPIRYILCAIHCLFSITGCMTTPYPDDWSRTVPNTASQCPDLSGSYENFGLWANGSTDGDMAMLARVFFPVRPTEPLKKYHELQAVSHVTLDDQGDDGLVVKAWVGDELLIERILTSVQLPCRDGRRVYHDTSWDVGGAPPILLLVAHTSSDHLISLAADGSLVMENMEFSMGAVWFIPVAAKAKTWYRFPRTSPDTPGLHTDSNNPHGVRSGTAPAYSLLPPEGRAKSHGYSDDTACLDLERGMDVTPDSRALAMLGGRSTQAFIIQYGRDGPLYPEGRHDGKTWVPATHELRIEKLNWQPPSVADRYVICLLRKGYRWEDRGELAVGQEFAAP